MTFRQRIAFDRLVAVPMCYALNLAVRVIGWLLKRDHSISPETTRNVVIAKLVGMGSIIQATPLLRALRRQFPAARITFLTLKSNRLLLERLELVDEVICLDDRSLWTMGTTTLSALWRLNRRRVDHYFDLEVYSGFASLLSLFSLARNRLGFYRHSSRGKRGIYTHLVYFNTRMPVRRLYLQLGCVAGVSANVDEPFGRIRIEPAERISLREKLAALGLAAETAYLLVNPNASDLLIERRWPTQHVVAAIVQLAAAGYPVVLMGSPGEADYVKRIAAAIPAEHGGQVFNSAGKLSLPEVFALIDMAACVLTNDTGPMHMAFAQERPTVCLFGPGDPTHYGMERKNVATLYAPVSCSPCLYEIDEPPCHGDNICMQRLQPELAVQCVLALLHDRPLPATRFPLQWVNFNNRPLGIELRHSAKEHRPA